MSYRIYIKKDYKPEVRWYPSEVWYYRLRGWILGVGCCALVFVSYWLMPKTDLKTRQNHDAAQALIPKHTVSAEAKAESTLPAVSTTHLVSNNTSSTNETKHSQDHSIPWRRITIKQGDNLSVIFERLRLGPGVLHRIMTLGEDTKILKHILPGKNLYFQIENDEFLALRYEPDLVTSLQIHNKNGEFSGKTISTKLETRIKQAEAVIDNSLFLAGQKASLSDNIIMRYVSIFGWDIDFALDIRAGDRFKLIYEEQYKEDKKVGEGPILVAEFINKGKKYRAVRYTSPDGHTGFYNEHGYSMRKAFLRTPVKFNRISSRFNTGRKHPILNRIRAHKGVDYAAPVGTPVKATGDGTVKFVGTKGGYGKTVILKHGAVYNTLYAHLSRYKRGTKPGKRVKQGDIIGYVGKTGLATGPHLHYEFQVNGAHRNPLTVKLPKALRIPEQDMAHFKTQTTLLLSLLDKPENKTLAMEETVPINLVAALKVSDTQSVH